MSRLPISSLILSPPEMEPMHNFDSSTATPPKMASQRESTPQHEADTVMSEPESTIKLTPKADPTRQRPPSPPESPISVARPRDFAKPLSRLSHVVDPTVFPQDQDENEDPLPAPGKDDVLFPPFRDPVDVAIQRHITTNAVHFVRGKSKGDRRTLRYQMPSMDEYRLAVAFVSTLGKQDPIRYLHGTRGENEHYYTQMKRLGARAGLTPIEVKPAKQTVLRPQAATRVIKPTSSPRKPTTPRVRPVSREGKSPRVNREGTPHIRHREPKKPADDKFWNVDDKSPSVDVLNNNPKALRIDWDGNPLDLSNDENRHLLHEAEYNLASALRLTCARYLTCKRRIFNARVEALRIGKEFKKTDAQQACQIDVNKASKLWMAYEKVGWLQPQLFKQYL